MNYILKGHEYINEIQTISQVFFQNEKFIAADSVTREGITLVSEFGSNECTSILYENGVPVCFDTTPAEDADASEIKRLLKLSMFNVLKQKTGQKTPWGILTGIRPTKIATDLLENGFTDREIEKHISQTFLVSPEKINLMTSIAKKERLITEKNTGNEYSLYLGIPFCPSRCRYCSFTSYPIKKYESRLDEYISAVFRELELTVKAFQHKRLESIYIGGGTPASLPAAMLERLLTGIAESTDTKKVREFTVEAGRPDAIDAEKLEVMKKYNVTRLSINPQTMNNETLEKIGRAHTAEQFVQKFNLARDMGFDNINTDLILGLPDEGLEDVRNTFEKISKLNPESVTVHTLAIKRSSALKEELISGNIELQGNAELIEDMLQLTERCMHGMNMQPYYMYRQKNMAGNFENVGYSRPGFECAYNVQIMEEKQTIVALGAGGISKIVNLPRNKIERIFNVKNVDEYLLRIDEMLERKKSME